MRHSLFLFRELVKRDFVSRYAGSAFGFIWSFAQPLWMLALFGFVFGAVLRVSLVGEPTTSFGVFVFCGLLPWTATHESLSRATTALTDNAGLVKKLRFPSQLLVLTVVATALLHLAIGLGLFVLFLAIRGELAWRELGWLIVAVPLQATLSVGLGLLLATAQVFFRDTAQAVGLALSAWFYLTPIVYPLSLVPASLRVLVDWNPLTPLVIIYRHALLGSAEPGSGSVAFLAGFVALMLVVGMWAFERSRPAFADEL